jgi:hypothetical protein
MGTERTFQVAPTLHYVNPTDDSPDDVIQYVNLDRGGQYSRFVEIHAFVTPLSSGWSLRFELEAAPGNKNPNDLAEEHRAGFAWRAGGAADVARTDTTNRFGHVHTILRLSTHGGDRFRVKVSPNGWAGTPLYTRWFRVWRKVYYELNVMEPAPDGTRHDLAMGDIEREFARAFLKLEAVDSVDNIPYRETIAWGSTWAQEQLSERFGAERYPNQISIMLGSRFAEAMAEQIRLEIPAATLLALNASPVRRLTLGRFVPYSTQRVEDWFVSGDVKVIAAGGGEAVTNLTPDKVALVRRPDRKYEVVVEVSHVPIDLAHDRMIIALSLKRAEEYGVAWTGTPYLFIPVGSVRSGATWTRAAAPPAERELMAEGILVHEIGHKVLMANASSPYYYMSDGVTNPGLGPHCMHPDAGQNGRWRENPPQPHDCTMHHSALGTRTFCPACVAWMRDNRLTGDDTRWNPAMSFWQTLRGTLWDRRGPLAGGA